MAPPIVSLCCVSDRPLMLPVLIACLRAQTFTDWECLVLDQGDGECTKIVWQAQDSRIQSMRVPRVGDWGQSAKADAALRWASGRILGFPNDDAYYAPPYLAAMVAALDSAPVGLAYCDWVYDRAGYAGYIGAPEISRIDVGGFLVTRNAFESVGWTNRGPEGDGYLVRAIIEAGFGSVRVPGFLYVKNLALIALGLGVMLMGV